MGDPNYADAEKMSRTDCGQVKHTLLRQYERSQLGIKDRSVYLAPGWRVLSVLHEPSNMDGLKSLPVRTVVCNEDCRKACAFFLFSLIFLLFCFSRCS